MSDNEDLLGDDLGDHSLADYNLGNEEEEQLLADDYDGGASQNVPTATAYRDPVELVPTEYSSGTMEYSQQPYIQPETESVVPNITVEVTNTQTYTPYRDTYEREHAVPPAIPVAPVESPQIVPSEITAPANEAQERSGEGHTQRLPLPRNIPDSLDKVYVPSFPGRGRSWRNPNKQFKPYRQRYNFRGHFNPRASFSPIRPQMRPDIPEIRHEMAPIGPEMSPERQYMQRLQFRSNMEDRPNFGQSRPMPIGPNIGPNAGPNVGPTFYQPTFNPRFPVREVMPNMPQVIRQPLPLSVLPVKEPEVRMLPVLPPNLPPTGLTGKKVLINPHFKGNFQPPVEGLAYIPTRINKTPPLSPTLEARFGPSAHVDEAAERFIAEQREALARAARREPMRYIENTTIEIENELARSSRRSDDDLLRRQEEFINANRAGLRRRMRSPSPRRSDDRRSAERRRGSDEQDSEYRRRVREQETLRERVLRAKEVRRRKNAVALQKHLTDRDKEQDKDTKTEEKKDIKATIPMIEQDKPDTTRRTPEKEKEVEKKMEKEEKRDRSPVRVERTEANSTCDTLTPPPLTPPLPRDSDDDLDLILDDIDDILSDDDTGRFKDNAKVEIPKAQVDLRSKLPPRENKPRQKIVFEKEEKKEKSPIRRTIVTGAKNNTTDKKDNKTEKVKSKSKTESNSTPALKQRQKIIFDKLTQKQEKEKNEPEKPKSQFPNRRVILQRKVQPKDKVRLDPSRPNPGIFSRALENLAPESDSGETERAERERAREGGVVALVDNLPFGMTDTRLKTLAGEVQNIILDREERKAKITFRNKNAAEIFRKKFNNKMVAASRLTVSIK